MKLIFTAWINKICTNICFFLLEVLHPLSFPPATKNMINLHPVAEHNSNLCWVNVHTIILIKMDKSRWIVKLQMNGAIKVNNTEQQKPREQIFPYRTFKSNSVSMWLNIIFYLWCKDVTVLQNAQEIWTSLINIINWVWKISKSNILHSKVERNTDWVRLFDFTWTSGHQIWLTRGERIKQQ